MTVRLTEDQESTLLELVTRGKESARTIRRAHTLLLAWEGKTDEDVSEIVRCSVAVTVQRLARTAELG